MTFQVDDSDHRIRPENHRTRKRGSPQSSLHRILSGNNADPGRKQAGIQHFPLETGQKHFVP